VRVTKILVGIDGSPRQPQVVRSAAELAVCFGAQLILVRVIGVPPEIPAEAWQCPDMDLKTFLEHKARQELDAGVALLPAALQRTVQRETLFATPWQGLCAAADSYAADLIVIGSHGYGGLDRVLGTTAARVVNHAACSVFVVRSSVPAEPAA